MDSATAQNGLSWASLFAAGLGGIIVLTIANEIRYIWREHRRKRLRREVLR